MNILTTSPLPALPARHFSVAVFVIALLASFIAAAPAQAQCGRDRPLKLTAAQGQISDRFDGVREEYPPEQDCLWLIQPTGARQIRLTFTNFATEEDFDLVTVYDGADTTARILGIFSGLSLPPTVVSSGGALLVRFTSDDDTQLTGWSANYFSSVNPVRLTFSQQNLFFEPIVFGKSSVDSVTLSGDNLQGDFRVAAPPGFKLSASLRSDFSDTIVIPNTRTSTTGLKIYVRFQPPEPGEFSGRLFVWNSTGIANVSLRGFSPPAIFWEPLNGPYAGNVLSLAAGVGNTVFAGTYGGVYRSNSGGAAWQQGNNGLNSNASQIINAVLTTARGVFIGTDSGVFRSDNNGRSWIRLRGNRRDAIAPDLLETTVYSLAGRNDTLFAATDEGVYRSFNNGATWLIVEESPASAVLLVEKKLFAGFYDDGAYIGTSDDFGDRWQYDETFDGKDYVATFLAHNNFVFAATDKSGVYRSSNGGDWERKTTGFSDTGAETVYAMATGGGVLYAATGDGVWRSNDDGINWQKSSRGLTESSVFAVVANGAEIFAGTDGGLFRSTNKGGQWSSVNVGLTAAVVTGMKEHSGFMFAGTAGSGVVRSSDNGATWLAANSGLRSRFISAFATKGRELYAASYDDFNAANAVIEPGLYRSRDNGVSWSPMLIEPIKTSKGPSRRKFHSILPLGNGLYAGSDSCALWRSLDNGNSWKSVTIDPSPEAEDYSVTAIAPGNGTAAFAGTNGYGLYRSPNPAVDSIRWVDVSPDTADGSYTINAMVRVGASLFVATEAGIYRTTTEGRTWAYVFPDANTFFEPNSTRVEVVQTLTVVEGVIYAGTLGNGVWRSFDNGFSWEKVNDGLNKDVEVYSMSGSGNGDLFVGLGGNVVYRSSLQLPFNASRAILEIPDTLTAKVGEVIEVPIILNEVQFPVRPQPTVAATLRFNASLLMPVDELVKQGSAISNGERLISVRFKLDDALVGKPLFKVRLKAVLGNSVATPLTLTNLQSFPGDVIVVPKTAGVFTLKGLSEAGGTRLFRSDRPAEIVALGPNPSADATTIRYELTESGATTLSLLNVFGQVMKTISATNALPGEYESAFTVADLTPGLYFVVLQTPSQRITQRMSIVR